MTLTSLFTAAELDSQIAAYKAALLALSTAQSYRISNNGNDRNITRADLPEIRNTLEWLQQQRGGLDLGFGAQTCVGRPKR